MKDIGATSRHEHAQRNIVVYITSLAAWPHARGLPVRHPKSSQTTISSRFKEFYVKTRILRALLCAFVPLAASVAASSALAGEVQVAVAANFTAPVQAIAADFE